MLEVTDRAVNHLAELVSGQEHLTVIRVAVMGGGGTRSGLGLVPDEARDTDIRVERGGYTLVVDTKLLEYCRRISIDFVEGKTGGCASQAGRGFVLDAENPVLF